MNQPVMPSKAVKTPRTAVAQPFLNRLIVPEKLDLVWDNTRGEPVNGLPSSFYGLHSANNSCSTISELATPSTPASSKSFTGKLWGIFSKGNGVQSSVIALTLPTNHDADPRSLMKEKSKPKVLKKHHTKSSPNIKSLTLRTLVPDKANTPIFDDLPPLPTPDSIGSSLGDVPLYLADNWEPQSPGSAIYFTVDPSWDPSKGDADVYLLPCPDATVERQSIAEGSIPRLRTSTHANKVPRNLKSVVKTDNETSFLFFK